MKWHGPEALKPGMVRVKRETCGKVDAPCSMKPPRHQGPFIALAVAIIRKLHWRLGHKAVFDCVWLFWVRQGDDPHLGVVLRTFWDRLGVCDTMVTMLYWVHPAMFEASSPCPVLP